MTKAFLLCAVVLAACDGGSGDDDGVGAAVTSCSDLDVANLNSNNVEEFVAAFQGRPCTAPLTGGVGSLLQECQYGAPLTVCGQSSGLSELGCSCSEGHLTCSNGLAIKEGQERLCDAGSDI